MPHQVKKKNQQQHLNILGSLQKNKIKSKFHHKMNFLHTGIKIFEGGLFLLVVFAQNIAFYGHNGCELKFVN